MKNASSGPQQEANQAVPLQIDTKNSTSSLRISFTNQRLTLHGGILTWSHLLRQRGNREQRPDVLPHAPTSPDSYDPRDIALCYMGGIICGTGKPSRMVLLQNGPQIGIFLLFDRARLLRCLIRGGPTSDVCEVCLSEFFKSWCLSNHWKGVLRPLQS